ncbi:MAG: hypothetical protein KZQ70_11010 [gamma proteobacterium symbiont of Lucinoma myriamae]|nr:hypothetical protein [gamma proteobacterium symbiont of Lucinoma myriamae]MCU7819411.1 hypothetical protein [gamma proteobacterium symbiont of Lucinoma myriamae]MCU7832965.1 hypothetical protein [gamma proteobacterium symbiont of Lucinoma myriamae]
MKNMKMIHRFIFISVFIIPVFSLVYSDEQLETQKKQQQATSPKERKIKQVITKPDKFIPSEKKDADSSVSFPVDI